MEVSSMAMAAPLKDKVFGELRDAIITGKISCGTKLIETSLAGEMGLTMQWRLGFTQRLPGQPHQKNLGFRLMGES